MGLASGRDENYSIFHSLGKILMGKRNSLFQQPTTSLHHVCLQASLLLKWWSIVQVCSCMPRSFMSVLADIEAPMFAEFLHANYLDFLPLDQWAWSVHSLSLVFMQHLLLAVWRALWPASATPICWCAARRNSLEM